MGQGALRHPCQQSCHIPDQGTLRPCQDGVQGLWRCRRELCSKAGRKERGGYPRGVHLVWLDQKGIVERGHPGLAAGVAFFASPDAKVGGKRHWPQASERR